MFPEISQAQEDIPCQIPLGGIWRSSLEESDSETRSRRSRRVGAEVWGGGEVLCFSESRISGLQDGESSGGDSDDGCTTACTWLNATELSLRNAPDSTF